MEASLWQTVQAIFAAVIDLPEDERAAYLASACSGRPELRQEVEGLLKAHWRAGPFLEPVPERVGPYRLLEEIGRGGMGSVYRAERVDGQFQHQVAIKLLSVAGSGPLYGRFVDERQILASLSHPNIARLLDGGVTPSGLSYIVMEYVAGVPLDRYSEGRSVQERLELFRTICAAVHYAHQNLVVHRDLKPGNILVTPEGDPKLLDFGIAKILARQDVEGTTVVPVMTPEYASPEQARGVAISTASDVYSLGVLLHEMLTGRRLYELTGKPYDEVLRLICEEPAHPRTGSADLDAIILKAVRKEPRDRYPSAEALAADLDRYLSKRPVAARQGASWYVFARFLARNRLAVATACIVALMLAAAGAITFRQSRIATRRFEDVRKLANSVVYQLHDAVAALPGSTAARKLLIANALEYLDKLSRDAGGDTALQLELGEAYTRLGDVQGLQSQANLGDPYGAIKSYREGYALLKEVVRRRPEDRRAITSLATTCRHYALVLSYARRRDEGVSLMGEAVQILEDLARREQGKEMRLLLAQAYYDLANVSGRPAEHFKALAIFEDLLKAEPNNAMLQRNVALSHKAIAAPLVVRSEKDRALPHLQRAEELDALRVASDPDSRLAQLDLSFDLSQNGTYFFNREQFREALTNFQKSLEIRRRLAASDPADARLQERLAFLYYSIGNTFLLMRRNGDALDAYQAEARISRALLSSEPRHPQYRLRLANSESGIGAAESGLGRSQKACAAWRVALRAYRDMDRDGQLQPRDRSEIEKLQTRLAACE